MRGSLEIELKESQSELRKMLKLESDPLLNDRIRALYLYSTGQYKHRKDVANAVGYGRNAVGRWFQTYEESGIKGLLSYGKAGNPRPLGIPPTVMEALQSKLNDPKGGFPSFKAAWLWLKEEHGIELSYCKQKGKGNNFRKDKSNTFWGNYECSLTINFQDY